MLILVGATTVAIGELDGDPPDAAIDLAPVHLGAWAVAVDGEPDGGAPLMALYGAVDDLTWTLAGRAVQLVEWTRTHRYCGRCASPTVPAGGAERALRCPDCGLLAFPRLAPAMIVLVTDDEGRALLARGTRFPIPMYSCLAGFVEPGETCEQAVHREVREEVGVEVRDVAYWGSQPWPFPHSLMLGFTARYAGGDFVLDETEILDAGWYRPDGLPPIPPGMSIARRMIDDWLTKPSP